MTKTNMLLVVAFGTVLVLAVFGTLNESNTAEVNTIEVEEVIEEVVQEVDVIDSANTELERINTELDQEETRLLEKKANNKADFESKQLELENRLEKIRETRTSFQ